LDDVPGIAFRRDGRCHVNPPAVVASAEDLPAPELDLVDRRHYRRMGRGCAVVVAGRGCPLGCSYCAVGGAAWLPHRLRPVGHVLDEIGAAVAAGAGFVDFEDENLSLDRGWFLALLSGMLARFGERALELRAMNGLFPPSLDAEIVTAMARAGFTALNLSLGSTDPAQLSRFRRPDVRPGFDRALALAERHGLDAVGYVVVGAPYQSAASSVDDLLWLAERRVLAGVSVFYPAPGSRDWNACRELGLLPAAFGRMRATALPVSHTTTRLESVTLLRLGRILNFMKQLVDRGLPLPCPTATAGAVDPGDRLAAGRALLARFLADGRVRGVTPEGEVYEHPVSAPLVDRFLAGLRGRPICGTASTDERRIAG
nr:radical SAM protein [Desulfobacterales bacterium]